MNLSIIVPVYNEIDQLPLFFEMLAAQQAVDFELIISDGGSDDGSVELIERVASDYNWPICLVRGAKGRAGQLNAGVEAAQAETLLFIHVDSSFSDVLALRQGLDVLDAAILSDGSSRIGGHFKLKFRRSDNSSDFGYYFWECKARLDRPECTHGDQGFLLRKSFYEEVGPFDIDAPIAEDTRLAERARATGHWLLLPVEIWTSARRFEVEGLKERQTMNALIMNFASIGWSEFFANAHGVYRTQADSDRLDMLPFFSLIDRLFREATFWQVLTTLYRTGIYVRPNAWQLAFLKDVKRNFSQQIPVDQFRTESLDFHDIWFDRLTDNVAGRTIAMVGTWIWYRLTVRHYRKNVVATVKAE